MARLPSMVEFLVYMFINFTEIKHLLTNKNVLKEDIIWNKNKRSIFK